MKRLTIEWFLVFLFPVWVSCSRQDTLFVRVPSSHSGILFNNTIIENDSINPLDQTNLYNGGGVGIGDFNNDGRPDIYFTGNLVPNKLYLNRGDFRFQDVTDSAGVDGQGRWSRGVAVVDINNDGWKDIYVCAAMKKDPAQRRNLLYVNQGVDRNGIPHFREMGAAYGLDDTTHSTMAAFFDYDNDGDLDLYLAVNVILPEVNPGQFRAIYKDGSFPSTGRLYRNDWNDSLRHPVFTNVSARAGITLEGYSHGVTIADINRDGWKDIYVTNDFLSNNILYINNHDGTFTDKAAAYFKHTSANAMGQDIEDMNNDGLADIIELDMDPQDNYRKKMMLGANNYNFFCNSEQFGYQYQVVRNTLQWNRGPHDASGDPIFSDIGFYAGIAETDWSWTPLAVDFDNDGYRDLVITNGYPRDVTDHDFTSFLNQAQGLASKQDLLARIPQVKLHKYGYHNNGDLTFSDVSKDWGLMTTAFSNGTAYADLDGDGDMDLVMNNINDEAMVFRNSARERDTANSHYLQVRFRGDSLNRDGLGAWVELHYDQGRQQVYEHSPYRGYLSSIQDVAHFGLGQIRMIDTVIVKWPDGKVQSLLHIPADQVLTVDHKNAGALPGTPVPTAFPLTGSIPFSPLFHEVTDSVGITYRQEELDFIDFNIQKLLPHKLSEYGPYLTVGDIDGNGLDDIVCGGSAFRSAQLFLQQPDGRFYQQALLTEDACRGKRQDDMGLTLFDADGDGDLDLYIATGGYESAPGNTAYADRLYINDGKGHFTCDTTALPANFTSKGCVRAADFDHDGDLDLFVSGRVEPWHYPQPVSSFVYRNDSKNGRVHFTDVTSSVAPALNNIGMICDAVWSDMDGDGWPDLVLAGEWMPVTFLKNDHGRLQNISASSGLGDHKGWWNCVVAGDFDKDGDMDYVVGNLGLNSFYRASAQYPVRVYGKDFDNNGIYDMIPSLYLPDSMGQMHEFPAEGRDDMLKQMNSLRNAFPDYRSFANATMGEVLTDQQRKGALILEATEGRTALLKNEGGGRFTFHPLPMEAQLSVVNGMVVGDFDHDGNLDLVLNGNDFGAEPSMGRYDAFNGLYLAGDGKGGFKAKTIRESGIYIPGNGKGLVQLKAPDGHCLLAAGENRGPLRVFICRRS